MNRRVVVTGLGAITPLGNNVKTFWDNLVAGKCGIGPITHFDTTDFKVKLAAEVRDFDPRQYMDKMDAQHADLYAQFAMGAACQAMEDSGVEGTVEPERMGVYVGTGIGGIGTFMEEHTKLLEKGPRRISPHFIPMMIANMAPGIIAIRFHCKNAALPAVTACASGSNAIGEALRAIRHGYADVMIAGGSEATVNEIALLKRLQPRASRPPSAKNRHWMTSTDASVSSAGAPPSMAASRMPPPMWPEEPVPGMVKLIIWAANANAPVTAMTGIFRSPRPSLPTRTAETASAAALTAYIAPPTAGETRASAMCMTIPPLIRLL